MAHETHGYVDGDHPVLRNHPWGHGADVHVLSPTLHLFTTTDDYRDGHGALVVRHDPVHGYGDVAAGLNLSMTAQHMDDGTVVLYVDSGDDMVGLDLRADSEDSEYGERITAQPGRRLSADACHMAGVDGSGRFGEHYSDGRRLWTV